MARKTVGYTELEWTCKRCGTKNPGLKKVCSNCGGPMAQADQFELPDEQKLITEPEKIEALPKGADVHCPYCGARNPFGSAECSNCGGNLQSGAAREAGQVLGAHQDAPAPEISCPFCAAKIKADSQRCPQCGGDLGVKAEAAAPAPKKLPLWLIIIVVLVGLLCVGVLFSTIIKGTRTETLKAEVQSVAWQREIAILGLADVRASDWEENVPAEASDVACEERLRRSVSEPVANAREVCGTAYTVDTGSGVGEVVQDCRYDIYESFCAYTTQDWQVIDKTVVQGSDLDPAWPQIDLATNQREGQRSEAYQVIFDVAGTRYTYTTADPEVFARFTPGSLWNLTVNAFGNVVGVEP